MTLQNNNSICGIDEAGRGPLAGPVCASAVILPNDFDFSILNDSKKLSEKKRLLARDLILEKAIWGIGWATHTEIDEINILNATMLAMKRAYTEMRNKINTSKNILIIVDGNKVPDIKNAQAVVKADAKYFEVMAASILAKTSRDLLMYEYAKQYPDYGYEKHKGYPTKAHREAIHKFGISPIQRKTFNY